MFTFRSQIVIMLLGYFLVNQESKHYINELAEILAVDPGNLFRKLKELENEGILLSEIKGNQRYYWLNKKYPLFNELKKSFEAKYGLVNLLKNKQAKKFINQIEPWYGKEEKVAVKKYLDSGGWLMEFKKTREFEESIAKFAGAEYCSVVNNGTVSLFIALKALNIGQGDEVIVPNLTMAATPNSVILAGAKPVFVDIEDKTLCLDVKLVGKAITKKTKAVFHVSLNGRAGELEKLKKLCQKKKIYLIEDAAQAFGSFYHSKHLGTHGIIGSFSFSVPKIITTGQGGALITSDKKLYEKILKIKDFGRRQSGEDYYQSIGWNFKFTDLQAVIGIEQIKKLPWRIKRKKEIYQLYKKYLEKVLRIKFIKTDLEEVTPWFIDIYVPNNKKLREYLKTQGIGSRLIYPALNSQPAYKVKGDFSVSQMIAQQGLWLPSTTNLTNQQIKFICERIKKFYEKN